MTSQTATEARTAPRASDVRELEAPGSSRNQRWALAGLLVLTGVLYLVGLDQSGWANSYYSAAALAGSQDWTAFLFGSFDASNAISVDKAPAALWPMALSVRFFGLSSWSLLVPQAIMGVASVALLYASVRRWATPAAGLLAGLVLALTPVAALIFRFNNPDALLMLLLLAAVYATQRGIERAASRAGTWWFAAAGVAVGFAFLAKMLQAFLIVPVLAAVVLLAAPVPVWRRISQIGVAAAATLVSAGWWVALVELTPADWRPYVGGSQTNSVLELIFGYNGLGRLTGDEVGSVTGPTGAGAGTSPWGSTGWDRVFGTSWGGQASWLLPAAALLLIAGLALTWHRPRTDRTRAALLIWGGWLVVTWAVFSFAEGIIHEYYAVALVPPIAAIVGIGAVMFWARREQGWARGVLAAVVVISVSWGAVLLGRAEWNAWLVPVVLVFGLGSAALLLAPWRRVWPWTAVVALAAVLLGPAAWTLQTVATPHTGSLPLAGPTVAAQPGGGPGGQGPPGGPTTGGPPTGTTTGGAAPNGGPTAQGGLLDASTPSDEVVGALANDAESYTWVAAAVGAQSAASYQLATELPVLAVGGFNGSDPSPTLAEFQQLVAAGTVHWFVAGDGGGPSNGGSDASVQITEWVASTFEATQYDGVVLYDLSTGTG